MKKRQPKTALITGASRGLGLALCHYFAQDGIDLVMVARNKAELNNAAKQIREKHGINVLTILCDLTRQDDIENLFMQLTTQGMHINYLVNNAGIGLHGSFSESDNDDNIRMLQININALVELTHRLLPDMQKRKSGCILNVASLVAFQPGGPNASLYYASKNFVLSFSKGLKYELAGSGISVTCLCPGPMRTHFQTNNGFAKTRLYQLFNNDVKATARAGYKAMLKGKSSVVPGLINKLLAFGGELPPRRIALAINHWLLATPDQSSPTSTGDVNHDSTPDTSA